MKPNGMTMLVRTRKSLFAFVAVLFTAALFSIAAHAQTKVTVRGTVTAINDGVLSIKQDSGEAIQVKPDDAAKISKLAPGTTEIKNATPATAADIAVGDRILLLATTQDSGPAISRLVYVMKAGDIAQQNEAQQAEWRTHGVGGIVRAVNAGANTITLASGAKTITVTLNASTKIERYAPDSVNFSDAKPATLADIKVNDQMQAKGTKNADGTAITADEVVAGSFRNISGLITAINPAANTFTVKDLATKTTVTVSVTANTDMHEMPAQMATMYAARLKGGAAGAGRGQGQGGGQRPAAAGAPGAGGARSTGADLTQMMGRLPVVTLPNMKTGDAVMVAATASASPTSVTAITVLGGVKPLLEAAPSSEMNLSPWSIGGGMPE